MFEQDLLDEEVKKKKRRVLVGLFVLLLGGTLAAFPLTEQLSPAPSAISEAAGETPDDISTGVPVSAAATATSLPATLTPPPPATATPAPTIPPATDEAVGGAGGGTLATATASLTPAVTPIVSATPTLLSELPAAGAGHGRGLDYLVLGLAAILLGVYMLKAGARCARSVSGNG